MHILVRSADLLQSSAIFYNHLQSFAIIWIILTIRAFSIIYVLRSTQKTLRATLPCGCFLVRAETLEKKVGVRLPMVARKVHFGNGRLTRKRNARRAEKCQKSHFFEEFLVFFEEHL